MPPLGCAQEALEARRATTAGEEPAGGRQFAEAEEEGSPAARVSPGEALAGHLAALASLPDEARGALAAARMAARPESLLVMGREAPVDVAVVAGCPPGARRRNGRAGQGAQPL
jgi:hypothetical protein